jgi:hypothetical protein
VEASFKLAIHNAENAHDSDITIGTSDMMWTIGREFSPRHCHAQGHVSQI